MFCLSRFMSADLLPCLKGQNDEYMISVRCSGLVLKSLGGTQRKPTPQLCVAGWFL